MDGKCYFLNNDKFFRDIIGLVASEILGESQHAKIDQRYKDMQKNFYNVTEWFAGSKHAKKYSRPLELWQFSEGITPFAEKGRKMTEGPYYTDTTAVTMPISHPDFVFLSETAKNESYPHRGAIGLDLPVWFGADMPRRVMIVAQDPLRNPYWYGNKNREDDSFVCSDAVLSSPFGLHDFAHREHFGGKRVWLLVKELLKRGIGVYLTDCRKYFYYSHEESNLLMKGLRNKYIEILKKEIDLFKPSLIVPLGKEANSYINKKLDLKIPVLLDLPHFSGAAGGAIAKRFQGCHDIKSQAEAYAEVIEIALSCIYRQ